jgi:hypothetical protein
MITTAGKLLLEDTLPGKYSKVDKPLTAKDVKAMMTDLAKTDPDAYVDTLQKINDLGREVVTTYGRDASISLKDLKIPTTIKNMRSDLRAKIKTIENSDVLSNDKKLDLIKKATMKYTDKAADKLYDEALKKNNSMAMQILSGSRGKKVQLQQMLFGDMLMTDATGKVIPYPGLDAYAEGAGPLPYWLGASSSRKGFIDTQFGTAQSGYFSKQLTNVAHRNIVTEQDCGTVEGGLKVDGDDEDNVGAVLLKATNGLKPGTVIKEEHLPELEGKRITVRSPLTCQSKEGVCAHCAGIREKGGFPEIGEPVGINAVRAFAEALTQGALGSKHVGGVGGKEDEHGLSGFKEINQFVQVPKEFVGGAVLADKDGKVTLITDAPQGGKYVKVDGEQYHIPNYYDVDVKKGDTVEAGDTLSTGVPNPSEVVGYKGLGEGRHYFLNKFRELTKKNNADTNRRNLELFTRAFISKVNITDPEGIQGHMLGDVIDYDYLASGWEPRDGSNLKSVDTAHNLYLEKPYMHYTIGTKITPKVSKSLKNSGYDKVMVHDKPAPFEPQVVRAQDFTRYDKDWITRLGGENLKRSMTEAASVGSSSARKSTSYFPALVNIREEGGLKKESSDLFKSLTKGTGQCPDK